MAASRRLDDRIQKLSAELIHAKEGGEDFTKIATDLRAAITEHVERLREKMAEYPATRERRKTK